MSPFEENREPLAVEQGGSRMSTGPVFLESCAADLSQRKQYAPVSSMKEMGNASTFDLYLVHVNMKILSVMSLTPLCRFASSEC